MEGLKFDFTKSRISDSKYIAYQKKTLEETKQLQKALKKEYEDVRASINLSYDQDILKQAKLMNKKLADADIIVVVGIGGSNLGTIAVLESIKGKLYNEVMKKQVYFADTVDPYSIKQISNVLKDKLKQGQKVVLNAISKSGGTTETIANFEFLYNVIKKNATYGYDNYIVITTGKDSKFEKYALNKGFNILNIPDKVGGRYSVFSQVGIFPLIFLGVNCNKLFEGANDVIKNSTSKLISKNMAIKSAVSIYDQYKKEKVIFNTFLFSTQLESLGKWYRQLLGESIGKEFDLNNKKVNSGIVPTVAIGSTDLHSMAQLYLGGPNNTFHCFVDVENKSNLKLPNDKDLDLIVPHIQKRQMSDLMDAILGGTKNAFIKKRIPFYTITMEKLDEYNIGAFLQIKMIEMIYLGNLCNVNPFNQPNVEEYKILTKKILSE